MHEAAWRGYSRCVKLLCTLPKDQQRSPSKKFGKKAKSVKNVEDEWLNNNYLNTRNSGGFSALHLASQNGHNQSCREILLAGADADVQNNVNAKIKFLNIYNGNHCIKYSNILFIFYFSMVTLHCIHHVAMDMLVQHEF